MKTITELTQQLEYTTDEKEYDRLHAEIAARQREESLSNARRLAQEEARAKAEHQARLDRFQSKIDWLKAHAGRTEEIDKELLEVTARLYWLADERATLAHEARTTQKSLARECAALGISEKEIPSIAAYEPNINENDNTGEGIGLAWILRFSEWNRVWVSRRVPGVTVNPEPITLAQMHRNSFKG